MNKTQLEAIINDCPYHQFLKLTVVSVDEERGDVTLKLPFRQDFSRSAEVPQVHGGITAALIDIAGDYAIAVKIDRGVPTINLRIDYLRMATNTDLTARATVIKLGRTIGVVDVEVRDDQGRMIAIGRGNYSVAA
jgi:uncharacterized protein (TIGR00369 family)